MKGKIQKLTLAAMLFAIAIVLSVVENMIPVPVPIPGIKYGLANIVVMYCLLLLGNGYASSLVLLKGVFSCLSKGLTAGALSITGGILSLAVMLLLKKLSKGTCSYTLLSIAGAICHNIGQLLMITVLYANSYLWAYLPVLLVSGVLMGILTAVLLKYLMPYFKRFGWMMNNQNKE